MFLRQKVPWTSQPPDGTPIDWSNPVVQSLGPTDLWVPYAGGGFNLCRRSANASTQKGQASIGVTVAGKAIIGSGITSTGSASGYETEAGAVRYNGAERLSIFAIVVFTGGQSGSYEADIIRLDNDANTAQSQLALAVYQAPSAYTVRVVLATSGISGWSVSNDVVIGLPELNVPYFIFARYDPSIENGIRLFVGPCGRSTASIKNGASNCTGVVSVTSGSSSDFQLHLVGGGYVGIASLKGGLLYAGVTQKSITKETIDALCINYWNIFQP